MCHSPRAAEIGMTYDSERSLRSEGSSTPAGRAQPTWEGAWKRLPWGLDTRFWGRLRWHFQELGWKDLADSGKDLGHTTCPP